MSEKLVLEAEVKSNISQQTKATREWGSAIKDTSSDLDFQKKMLMEMEKDLLKLQKTQANLSDYENGLNRTTQKIKEQKLEIKDQKLQVKGMSQEQKAATAELKKYNDEQKASQKAIDGTIGNFKVFGVSLNGIKKSVKGIIPLIRTMFATITAGIASTGIGALLIALGSLATYFTSTKKGADTLKVALAGIGATVAVLRDRVSKFGGAIVKLFKGDVKGALTDVKDSVTGIVEEVKEEVAIMTELARATLKLRDAENEFTVAKAKTSKAIAQSRLDAKDETKSLEERRAALVKSIKLQEETTAKELELAREKMRIQQEAMKTSQNLEADEKKLADLTADVYNKEAAALMQQRTLKREINQFDKKIADEKQKVIDAENEAWEKMIADNDAFNQKQQEEFEELLALQQENALAEIDVLRDKLMEELRLQEEADLRAIEDMDNREQMKIEIQKKYARLRGEANVEADKVEAKSAEDVKNLKISLANQGLVAIQKIAGEGTALAKAAAIAQATIAGVQGVQNAFTSNAANAPATVASAGAFPFIQAGLAATFAGIQIAAIMSQKPPSASGGGGGGGGGVPDATTAPPAPQMMSGAFELGGGITPEPMKAFVVTDEMTNSQNQLANIRRRATI